MIILQKPIVAAAIAIFAGAGVYAAHTASQLETELRSLELQQQQDESAESRIKSQTDQTASQSAAFQSDNEVLRHDIDGLAPDSRELAEQRAEQAKNQLQTLMTDWLKRVSLLQQRLDQTPGARIPEMELLADQDWLNVTRTGPETESQYRQAMSRLRYAAQLKFCSILQTALSQYSKATGRQLPTDLTQLQPYLPSSVEPAMLQRYTITAATAGCAGGNTTPGNWGIEPETVVDKDYDFRFTVTQNGVQSEALFQTSPELYGLEKAFTQANNGQPPNDPAELLPYAATNRQRELVRWEIKNRFQPDEKPGG